MEPPGRGVEAGSGWPVGHLRPPCLGEATHLGNAVVAEHIGVALDGVDEDVPLAVDVEGEQPASERDGFGPDDRAGLVVERFEVADDHREVAGGVVGGAHRLVDPAEGVLGELDHRLGLAGGQQRADALDGTVHLPRPRAVGAGVAAAPSSCALGSERIGERATELHEVEGTAGLGDLQEQLVLERRVALDLGHEQLDEPLPVLAGEMLAQLGRCLLRQLGHVAPEGCESFRAPFE